MVSKSAIGGRVEPFSYKNNIYETSINKKVFRDGKTFLENYMAL